MSGPCLSSSVAGRPLRPATRHSLGEPLPHQLADRPRAYRQAPGLAVPSFSRRITSASISRISALFSALCQTSRKITHVLHTLSPLLRVSIATNSQSFDLHVLSTPPAFVLSQNQTLQIKKYQLFVAHSQIQRAKIPASHFIESLFAARPVCLRRRQITRHTDPCKEFRESFFKSAFNRRLGADR